MNSIGKHLPLIGILILTAFVGAAAGLYFDVPARLQSSKTKNAAARQFTCPMHPDVVKDKPGDCPRCGMALILASGAKAGHNQCGDSGQNHPSCCADKGTTAAATERRLPPGHPPIPGWTTDATPNGGPSSSNISTRSSH